MHLLLYCAFMGRGVSIFCPFAEICLWHIFLFCGARLQSFVNYQRPGVPGVGAFLSFIEKMVVILAAPRVSHTTPALAFTSLLGTTCSVRRVWSRCLIGILNATHPKCPLATVLAAERSRNALLLRLHAPTTSKALLTIQPYKSWVANGWPLNLSQVSGACCHPPVSRNSSGRLKTGFSKIVGSISQSSLIKFVYLSISVSNKKGYSKEKGEPKWTETCPKFEKVIPWKLRVGKCWTSFCSMLPFRRRHSFIFEGSILPKTKNTNLNKFNHTSPWKMDD